MSHFFNIGFQQQLYQALLAHGSNSTNLTDIFRQVYLSVDSSLSQYEYEGCTATSVLIWKQGGDRYLQAANVGDSTAFLKRGSSVLMLSHGNLSMILHLFYLSYPIAALSSDICIYIFPL